MTRYLLLLPLLALTFAACANSDSGDAPSPVSSIQSTLSAAGLAAITTGPLDPLTCEGVLGSPPSTHTLELQSLTDSGQGGPQVESMCSALYQTSDRDIPFLVLSLINFGSNELAIATYDRARSTFISLDKLVSEVNSSDEDLLDHFSALQDSGNIGRTTVLRHNRWVLTVSNGPTVSDSLWTTDDLQLIGESILRRARQ